MIWVILSVICLVVFVVGCIKDWDEDICGVFLFGLIAFGIISIIVVSYGVTIHTSLKCDKIEIVSLQKRIIDIRKARYSYKKDGKFIAGSIENSNQSTTLSNYIKMIAEKEAEYNSDLICCKSYKKEFILYMLTYGFFISDKIYELEYL